MQQNTEVREMAIGKSFYEEYVVGPDNVEGSIPGISRLANDDILAVYMSPGEIKGVLSSDNGRTWEDPFLIVKGDDIGDPSLLATENRVLLNYSSVESIVEGDDEYPRYRSSRWMQKMSSDNGRTWGEAKKLETGRVYCASPHEGIVLRSKMLVWPFTWVKNCEGTSEPLEGEMVGVSSVMKSSDGGETWVKGGDVNVDTPNGADEPSVVELKNGDLFMIIRTAIGRHYQSVSSDSGKTWSEPEPSMLVASNTPAALYRITHDPSRVLVVWDNTPYIHAPNRFPLNVAVSYDECKTWAHCRILTNPGCQVSYPGITAARDGTILVIWQQWLKKKFIYPPFTNIRTRLKCARFSEEWLSEGSPL